MAFAKRQIGRTTRFNPWWGCTKSVPGVPKLLRRGVGQQIGAARLGVPSRAAILW